MKKSVVITLIISLTAMLFAVLFVACDDTVRHSDSEHVYSFYSDERRHFEECVCGDTKNEGEHAFDENGICSVCGYDKYLIYELRDDGQSYRVEIDRDAINGISCYVFNVPDTFKGLPVKEIAPSGFRDSYAKKITVGKNCHIFLWTLFIKYCYTTKFNFSFQKGFDGYCDYFLADCFICE